jgi:hypothetical protein
MHIDRPRKERFTENQFYLESNYWLYNLMFSGKVLYGDPVGKYVSKTLDNLLKDNPALRSKLRVYMVKSSALNAFTTEQGVIYVTLGLVARLRSEAELASILAHEVIHYQKKHIIKGYFNAEKYKGKKEDDINTRPVYEDSLIRIHNYSQSLEFQADTLGFFLFSKSNFSATGVLGAFELLTMADQPVFDEPFDYSMISSLFLTIHDTVKKKEDNIKIDAFSQSKETTQSRRSTHPDVNERNKVAISFVNRFPKKDGQDFIQNEKEFSNAVELSQLELCNTLIEEEKYSEALLHSSVLMKKYPGYPYIKKQFIRSYHAYVTGKGNNTYYESLLVKLADKSHLELLFYDIKLLWEAHVADPEDADMLYLLHHAVKMFSKQYPDDLASFTKGTGKDTSGSESLLMSTMREFFSKPELIAQLSLSSNLFSLVEDVPIKEMKSIEKGKTLYVSSRNITLDFRMDHPYDYEKSENSEIELDNYFQKGMQGKKFSMDVLSPLLKQKMDARTYNNYVTCLQIINDAVSFEGCMLNNNNKDIKRIRDEYGARYLLWNFTISGVINDNLDGNIESWFWTMVFPPLIPFVIDKQVNGTSISYHYSILIDMEKSIVYIPEFTPRRNAPSAVFAKNNTIALLKKMIK